MAANSQVSFLSVSLFSLELRPALGASLPVKHCVHIARGWAALLRQTNSKSFNRADSDNKGSQVLPKFENIRDATDYMPSVPHRGAMRINVTKH